MIKNHCPSPIIPIFLSPPLEVKEIRSQAEEQDLCCPGLKPVYHKIDFNELLDVEQKE